MEPKSPALAGRFFTTEASGKPVMVAGRVKSRDLGVGSGTLSVPKGI